MEEITITLTVNRQALNAALGNTMNVTAKEAVREVLESLVNDGLSYGCGCGCNCWEPDPLPIDFYIQEE